MSENPFILEGFFDNLYGLWARVRKADGTYLDVHPSSLNMVDSPAPLIKQRRIHDDA